ncbi:T9SS type A sorting domain-containing protein [Flavobacterium rhizosphaerae]|uniref:T9SS type A sorting domain-containing protein n=1 Tax=Flavobacterium rhizosphaerae TaxID=3163298 RepID=A0ABW8YVA6_9FLAO
MKRKLFLILSAISFSVSAQIPIDGLAPDFTATDIDGNQHHLQEYLNEGKTVILDFFATWCTPCWGYHSSHVFSDMYQAYGPDGSDELIILMIECDPQTNMDDLKGLTEVSRGNWLKGTPYPVIDDHTIKYNFPVSGYPEWIKICPDGSQFYIQGSASNPDVYGHYTNQMSGCNGPLTGIENHAEISGSNIRVCSGSGINDIDFEVINYGTNDMQSVTVALKKNGTVIHSETYADETFEMYSRFSATLSNIAFNSGYEYTIEVTEINGQPAFNGALESNIITIDPTPQSGGDLTIKVYTDYYPAEISWDITDTEGNVLIGDGPYQAGNDNISGGGGPDGLAVKSYTLTLPEDLQECYHVNLYDEFGDGWNTVLESDIHTGLEIISNGNQVLFIDGMTIGEGVNEKYAFQVNGNLSATQTIETNPLVIYPNPSQGIFNFTTQNPVSITVIDVTGKVVYTASGINNNDAINLSSLQKGIYIARVKGTDSEKIQKLVIN